MGWLGHVWCSVGVMVGCVGGGLPWVSVYSLCIPLSAALDQHPYTPSFSCYGSSLTPPFPCHSVHFHRPLTFHRVLNDRILAWAAGAQHERPGGRSLTLPPSLPLFLPSLPLSSSSPALPLSSFSMPPPPPTPDSSSAVTSRGLFPLGSLFLLPHRGPPPPSSPSG